jgi:methyl-accepting chemotaxis protein
MASRGHRRLRRMRGAPRRGYHRVVDRLGIPVERLALVLLAFGGSGIVLAGALTAALIAGSVAAFTLDERLADVGADVATSLREASAAIGDAVVTTERARAALGSGSDAVRETSGTLATLATATSDLAGALDFTIFGQQPMAGVAATFDTFADDLRRTSRELVQLSGDLADLDDSLGPIADDLRSLERRFEALAGRFESGEAFAGVGQPLGIGLLLLAAMAGWLLVAAAAAAWVGWRLRHTDAPAPPVPGRG